MPGVIRRLVPLAALVASAAVMTAVQPLAAPTAAQGAPTRTAAKPYVKVGYFTQWSIYGRNFHLSNVQASGAASRLTHLDYAFGSVTADGVCGSADPWADWQRPVPAEQSVDGVGDVFDQPVLGNLNQLAELKALNPKLRVLISLGGWTLSQHFSDAALTDASRKKLVSSCVDLWLKGNLPGQPTGAAAGIFDGVDLDWEWPASEANPGNVVRPEDKRNFTLLAREFRAQLTQLGRTTHERYDVTAFLPAAPATISAGYEASKLFRHLDFATVQGYDFHTAAEPRTNQQSSLRVPTGAPDDPGLSVSKAVNTWIARGAPRSKVVLGVPYYSRGWTGVTAGGDGRFAEATGPATGTWEAGVEDYKAVKSLSGFTLYRDTGAGSSWLFDGSTYWTYDDAEQLLQKTRYIRSKGLRGAMMWSLDGDDDTASLTKAIDLGLRSRR